MDGGTPLALSSGTDTHLEQLRTLKREFDQLSHQGHLKEALECREAFAEVEKAYYLSPARDVANSILALNSVAIKTLSEGDADGLGNVARFNAPVDITISPDGSALFVADHFNHKIRRMVLAFCSSGAAT